MGNDFFLNHATKMVSFSYNLLGKAITNKAINSTAGSIFTSGENSNSLCDDIDTFNDRNIGGIGNYVVEGLDEIDNERINSIESYVCKTLNDITEDGQFGHFAIKLSALLSLDAMTELSEAQNKFSKLLLCSVGDFNKITVEKFLIKAKEQLDLDITPEEAGDLFALISFEGDR